MREHLSLEADDLGATEPAPEQTSRSSRGSRIARSEFLKKAAVTGGVLGLGGALIGGLPDFSAAAPPSAAMDVRILNFFLRLEYLQAAFYAEASSSGALTGEPAEFAQTVGEHELAHVAFLEELLGDDAEDEPSFDFGDATSSDDAFTRSALTLEETTSAAYIGQGANLTSDRMLAAARIVSVEARHAAWIRDIFGQNPAPLAADTAMSEAEVTAAIKDTGFVG
ncbi:hypothetical protein BH24ACT26_BH24ACT26_13330 [soil metagenome]